MQFFSTLAFELLCVEIINLDEGTENRPGFKTRIILQFSIYLRAE